MGLPHMYTSPRALPCATSGFKFVPDAVLTHEHLQGRSDRLRTSRRDAVSSRSRTPEQEPRR